MNRNPRPDAPSDRLEPPLQLVSQPRPAPARGPSGAASPAVDILFESGPALHARAAQLFELRTERSEAAAARKPVVLMATTTRWISSARQALAFSEAGFDVEAVCPKGHALGRLDFIRKLHPLDAFEPHASLRRAIAASEPDLIAPSDDRVVARLHQLYAAAQGGPEAEARRVLIARSLGDPAHFGRILSRPLFMDLAADAGVRRPETVVVCDLDDLKSRLREFGYPAVLKTDGSWGGNGVAIVHDFAAAKRAYRRLCARPSLPATVKQLMLEKDLHFAAQALREGRPVVSLQRFIKGRAANAAAACWQGEVLSVLCVEAVRMTRPNGQASVVRTIENLEMCEAVEAVARRLGLSGLCGFDFLIDEDGAAWLLELNPRSTPTCHLSSSEGVDPASALCARLGGPRGPRRRPRIPGELIALFPQEMARNPASELLLFAWHDVPSRHPGFVKLGLETVGRERWRRLYRKAVRRFQERG